MYRPNIPNPFHSQTWFYQLRALFRRGFNFRVGKIPAGPVVLVILLVLVLCMGCLCLLLLGYFLFFRQGGGPIQLSYLPLLGTIIPLSQGLQDQQSDLNLR